MCNYAQVITIVYTINVVQKAVQLFLQNWSSLEFYPDVLRALLVLKCSISILVTHFQVYKYIG